LRFFRTVKPKAPKVLIQAIGQERQAAAEVPPAA
jgi:hypothetical protein